MIQRAHPAELHHLCGVRVLVVEDDPDVRENVVRCLTRDGAEVFSAATGNSGFERFVEVRPQVVLSDLWMPDGTGYELIARIRDLSPEAGGFTPAIAFSAANNARVALRAGFQVFLAKPVQLFRLVSVVGELAR